MTDSQVDILNEIKKNFNSDSKYKFDPYSKVIRELCASILAILAKRPYFSNDRKSAKNKMPKLTKNSNPICQNCLRSMKKKDN